MPREVITDAKLNLGFGAYPCGSPFPGSIFCLPRRGGVYEEVLLAFLEEWMPSMDGS
jgi:hypothetical protein